MNIEKLSNEEIVLKLLMIIDEEEFGTTIIEDVYEPIVDIELDGSNNITNITISYTYYKNDRTKTYSNILVSLVDVDDSVKEQDLLDCFNDIKVRTANGTVSVSDKYFIDDINVMLVLSNKCRYIEDLRDLANSIEERLNIGCISNIQCNVGYYNEVKELLLNLNADEFVKL